MESINSKIAAIIGLNILIVLILIVNQYFSQHTIDAIDIPPGYEKGDIFAEDYKSQATRITDQTEVTGLPVYTFDDPVAAVRLLESLERGQEVGIGDIPGTGHYTGYAGGYDYNNKYCRQHRVYMVDHPEIVFKNVNFITNYWKNHKLRTQIIPEVGYDIQPELTAGMTEYHKEYKFDFKLQGTIFFMHNVFFMKRQVGVQYSCLSQASNHIAGHDGMARKDRLGESLVEYAEKYSSRPQCFNFDKNFPKTWVMQKKEQCLDFFKDFNSPQYKELKKERKVVYFRKIGANVHEGKGVFPVTDEEEKNVRDMYNNGKKCGTNQDNNLMQLNIHDLLLLDNRKFGVRMYLFIASVNPVIAYYHDGYYRLSVHQYDPTSMTKGTFVTNIGVNLVHGVDKQKEEEIQEDTCWFNDDFFEYLYGKGIVTDPNWLQNELRPEYKRVMIHLVRMAQSRFFKISSVFELFGIDFVMGSDLKLWFIEANATPLINGFSKDSTKLINKMMMDVFEIVIGLLRSRMKRVVLYINEISKDLPRREDIPNLGDKRKVFKELIKNRFEPEYLPSADNGFELIIDENLEGVDRYAGFLTEECL